MYSYFPESTLDDFHRDWYSKHLSALWEPTLPHETRDTELFVIRFLWLRTFHRPIVVRAEVSGWPQIVCKMGSGMGGYEPGELIRNERYPLSDAEAGRIRLAIETADFWDAPTQDPSAGVVLDGARWVFEGVRHGRYHVVDRWSPSDVPWRRLGETLLEQARLVGKVY